jgi:arginyl-tRNA synthetase
MIPGDIDAELAAALRAMRLADAAAGTWRPAPPGHGGGPGTYATSVPIVLGQRAGRDPGPIAAGLAHALARVPWIAAAKVTGPGYLTVTVAERHLRDLPARITAAKQAAAPIPAALPDPASAPDWVQAWKADRDALVVRLLQAAGTDHSGNAAEHPYGAPRRPPPESPPGPVTGAAPGPVADAVAWHGADAVRYALARTPEPRPAAIERQLALPLDLDNPFVATRYAHAHAASTARWAADLAGAAGGAADSSAEASSAEPVELELLDLLSWREERVAAAARRRRPAELCAYLEHLAAAYLRCEQECPAVPVGGAAAPPDPVGPRAATRLELAAATRVVLAAGLQLAGVSSPGRIFGI